MLLVELLRSKRRGKSERHTHTWFSSGHDSKAIQPLSFLDNGAELRRSMLEHVSNTPARKLRRDTTGPNSVTEKVHKDAIFPFFVDIDFKLEQLLTWQTGGESSDWSARLIAELRGIVQSFAAVVAKATGGSPDFILATRLPYKLHIYWPKVFVSHETALGLFDELETCLRPHSLYQEEVLDKSVYTSGLRLIWCHKGGMGKGAKEEEIAKHEAIFGGNSWSEVYEITDPDTWEKKATRALQDLEETSLLTTTDRITHLTLSSAKQKGKAKGKGKHTGNAKAAGNGKGRGKETMGTECALEEFLGAMFDLNPSSIQLDSVTVLGQHLVLPTRSRNCPFAEREHAGNHLYIVVSDAFVELRCHDPECTEVRRLPIADIPSTIRELLEHLRLGSDTTIETSDALRLESVNQSFAEIKRVHPRINCEVGPNSTRWSPGWDGYATELPNNRWCPVCLREHDNPENCIITRRGQQQILCKRDICNPIVMPLADQYMKVIFSTVNNVQINVTGFPSGGDLGLDGHFHEVFPIFADAELNRIMLGSFKGHSYNIAKVIHYLGRERLGLGESKKTDIWWVWEEKERRWICSNRLAGAFVSEVIAGKFQEAQQWFRENTEDKKLAAIRECKLDTIIKRLQDKDKKGLLKDAAEVFEVRREPSIDARLDANPYLLGFEGEVYDLETGCAREAVSTDYVSKSVGYPVPRETDAQVEADIWAMLRAMQPEEEQLDYLITWLASTLDGNNAEETFTIWTGSGRNGKSVLLDLMQHTLGEEDYFHPLQATMLTNERPSSSKPIPDLLHLRGKRLAATSEPEKDKRINAGFVKFLTGNDMISGCFKHENDEIKFKGQHSLLLLCNAVPEMDSQDGALWDRARVVYFPQKFVDEPREDTNERLIDRTLKQKLKGWAPHFMRILLDKYKVYRQYGLRPTAAVLQATNAVKDENNEYIEFIEEHYIKTENERDRIAKSVVNDDFKKWCQTASRKGLMAQTNKGLAALKTAMVQYGFDLGEQRDADGQLKTKRKRMGTEKSVPAFSYIRQREEENETDL